MRYVSLHHHSTFSYMDGYGPVKDHVTRAAKLGMSAMALTEHGNVSSHVQLEQEANKAGIKPIFGLEAYTAPEDMREQQNQRKWHLTLLAQNEEGYRNLMRLVTRSWAEGFYRWPTITWSMFQDHHEGLIVLSGCSDSKLACDLLGGKGRETGSEHDAKRTIQAYKELLGDRFYLEVQQFPELARTHQINEWYASASRRFKVPLVATADVHYPKPDDNKMQTILHAAGRGGGTVESAEAEWEYDIRLTHPISDKQILRRLRGTGLRRSAAERAIDSTAEIAERCNVVLPKVERLRYPAPPGISSSTLIWEWLREGWRYRIRTNKFLREDRKRYADRLKYEMGLIEEKDFVDYFLMLSEAVRWCKDRGIPVGPARGSAAASLVCYLLRITEIDPMQFPIMLFERFIDINRTDLPDVDLDFDDELRHLLVEHMAEVYGEDRVANLGTFTKYRGKNALIDVARVYRIPEYVIGQVKGLIIERSGGDSRYDASLEDTVQMFPIAQEVFENHPVLWNAVRLEGNMKGMGIHAAGLLVGNTPLTDNVAMYTRETGSGPNKRVRHVSSVDKYDAEYLGLLKADLLGLSTMGMIRRALEMIGVTLPEMYEVANPAHEDPKVIEAFRRNDVTGVFQFTGGATKIVNGEVRPDTFLELCDINALSRPGPLHSGSTADYVNIKHGRMEPEHFHPIVDEITKHTKYCIIYQEQILEIVRKVGGFPWTHAAAIRKIISLKKGEAAFNAMEGMFIEGAARLHGISEDLALRIWRRLVTAGTYAFNAAHCVSYSTLAYWTMWLKVYHPLAFYTAALHKFPDDEFPLLRDAIKHGIEVFPPHPEKSGVSWAAEGHGVRAGLMQIPGIGESKAMAVIEHRNEHGLSTWDDLILIKGFGEKTVYKMQEFAESKDPFKVYRIERILEPIRKGLEAGDYGALPLPTHRGDEIPRDGVNDVPVVYLGIPNFRNPQDVVEDERARTGEEFETIRARMKRPDLTKKMAVQCVDDSDVTVYLRFWRIKWDRESRQHVPHFQKFEKALWDIRLDRDVVLVKGVRRAGGLGSSVHVDAMWVFKNDEDAI